MRQNFERILGEELRCLAIEMRERFNLTQREMSEQLQMSESSYSDIETGETICASALTETLLLCMHNNPDEFLNRVSERFEEALQLV